MVEVTKYKVDETHLFSVYSYFSIKEDSKVRVNFFEIEVNGYFNQSVAMRGGGGVVIT